MPHSKKNVEHLRHNPLSTPVPAFSAMLTSVLEQTGESQDFWAGKFDLDRSHLNKLLRGKRAVGPKAAGRLISCLPQKYHQDLIAAHLFDELLAVTSHMGTSGKHLFKGITPTPPTAAKVEPDSAERSALTKFFGPYGPNLQRMVELQHPGISTALERFLKEFAEKPKP